MVEIKSTFALLDVMKGRKKLSKEVEKFRIPVIIYGYIDGQHGHDDGTSIEFSVDVERVNIKKRWERK